MRTTITLTPEAEALVKKAMKERSLSFKDAVNSAIVDGLRPPATPGERYVTPTFDMGEPLVPMDDIKRLLGDLDDEDYLRKRASGR